MEFGLRRRLILSASLIVLIFAFTFLSLTFSQRSSTLSPTITAAPLTVGAVFRSNSELLNQSTRMSIYNFVVRNPGTQFRGICSLLNLPVGVAQYHLDILTKAGFLSTFRDGRYKRYFESKRFTEAEMSVISLLKHETAGKILSILLEGQAVSHKTLSSQLEISSQALTWQINRLKDMEFIKSLRKGTIVEYSLDEASVATVRRCTNLIRR